MGRKLEINDLSDEEQKRILEVIQRDYDLRKKEANRIGELSKTISETGSVDEKTLENCVVCGGGFVWLFKPKAQCLLCQFNFCKNNSSCGTEENEKWFCALCFKQRELTIKSADWFYLQLKSKFRRHGGAKIVREFYKKKKSSSQTGESPEKPPRTFHSVTTATDTQLDKDEDIESNQEHSIEVSLQTVEENQPDDTNTSLDETEPHSHQYDMKQQLEDAIATILLPKLEEMRDSSLHRDEREIAAVAEETIERFLRHMELKNAPSNGEILPGTENENDALMWRYLQDHKQNILMRFARKMNPELPTQNGSVLKDAETMTEGNTDSDVESLHSLSSSLRSSIRTKDRTPLSERVRNLSPESLREALNHGSSSDPGAKASRKDEMIAKAYVDATFSQLLETTVKEQDQEFSTEVNFTTVDGESSTNHQRKDSNTSESSEEAKDDNIVDDNWVVPTISPKLRTIMATGRLNAYVPLSDSPSAYDHVGGDHSDSDVDNDVDEEEIWPVHVRKNYSEISARSLGSEEREVVDPERLITDQQKRNFDSVDEDFIESMNQELENSKPTAKKEGIPQLPLIEEEPVVPVDRSAREMFQKVAPLASVVAAFQSNMPSQKQGSQDSAYNSESDAASYSRSRANETLESDAFSSSSSLDGSMRATQKLRPSLFYPEKDETRRISHEKPLYRLKSNEEILKDDVSFGDRLSEAIARQSQDLTKTTPVKAQREDLSSSSESESNDDDGDVENHPDKVTETIQTVENVQPVEFGRATITEAKIYQEVNSSVENQYEEQRQDDEASVGKSTYNTDVSSDTEIYTEHDIEDALSDAPTIMEKVEESLEVASSKDVGSDTEKVGEGENKKKFQIKTIEEIVAELKQAGMEVKTSGFKRPSTPSTPQTQQEKKELQRKPRASDPGPVYCRTRRNPNDVAKIYGVTIDPGKYKKAKEVQDVSEKVADLVKEEQATPEKETESDKSLQGISPNRLSVGRNKMGESLIREPGDTEFTSLPSVAKRRSVFTGQASPLPSPVPLPVPSPRLKRKVDVTQPGTSDTSDDSKSEKSIPIVKESRDVFDQALNMEVYIDIGENKTSIVTEQAHSVTSKSDESDSDASSVVSPRVKCKKDNDDNAAAITSDPDKVSRQMTSPVAQPDHIPDIVVTENTVEKSRLAHREVKTSPEFAALKSTFELDRSSPVRGSITMRGSRMTMTVQPDQGPQFQIVPKRP